MKDLVLASTTFALIICVIMILRVKIGEKFKIEYSYIVLAIIPVVLWLLLTGKIQKLEVGELKIETAFVEASRTPVSKQIKLVRLPVETLTMNPKGGSDDIPQLVRDKTEALTFRLGYGHYYGPVIEDYLNQLCVYPFFKHIIINQNDEKFFGLLNAREVKSIFSVDERRYEDFAYWINHSNRDSLLKLEGFVSVNEAIRKDTDKQTALERMETLNIETLPVISEEGIFVGVVERSRLTSSLIIDVAKKVK